MRVISGIRKGKKLIGPKKLKFRPTTDSTKEFIFNYLGNSVVKKKVLDLFSGTGSLGIEALSRGATEVVFIERDKTIFQIIHKNLKITNLESQAQVINSDVFRFIKWLVNREIKFDLIFADPPYQSNLYIKLIKMIDEKNPLTKDGMFILEHQSNESIATNLTNLTLQKTRILGNTTISFFTKLGG